MAGKGVPLAARLVQAGLLALLVLALALHAQSYREEACSRLQDIVEPMGEGYVVITNTLPVPVVVYTDNTRLVVEPGSSLQAPGDAWLDACLASCVIELGCRVRATSGLDGSVGGE